MNFNITSVVLMAGLLAACVPPQPAPPPPPPAAAVPAPPFAGIPPERVVSIRGADCAHLLALPPDDREAASMFYLGYQSSRIGARTISVMQIPVITTLAVSYCEQHPNATVASAFAQAYVYARTGG